MCLCKIPEHLIMMCGRLLKCLWCDNFLRFINRFLELSVQSLELSVFYQGTVLRSSGSEEKSGSVSVSSVGFDGVGFELRAAAGGIPASSVTGGYPVISEIRLGRFRSTIKTRAA